jgi:DNA polymerase-4
LSILADFTPEVEPVGLDEAYLDITGLREETAQEVALHLKDRIKGELDLTASIGIATCKVVAKVASDQCKPDGMLEVAPREERRFLTPLPVSQLPGVGRKTEQRLRNMRVTTMGQLADKPLSLLQQTFGVVGERLHCHANGIDESKVRPPAPPKSFGQETTFAEDTLDGSFLRAILYSLSEQVGAELRQQGRQARCITLKLRYADFKTITRSRTLKGATNADRIIFEVGLQLLERALGERRKLVRLLGIRASNLAGTERQLPLLNFTEEKQIQLNQAVDRIRHKYGFDSVYTGKVLPLKEVNQRD